MPTARPSSELYTQLAERDAARLPGVDTLVVTDDLLEVPYPPDPLALGVALRGLPGTSPGTIGTIDADGTLSYTAREGDVDLPTSATIIPFEPEPWPQAHGLRLVLADGPGTPEWDAAARVLTVHLAKGQLARVPVSSWTPAHNLELMGVWQWIREYAAGLADSDPDRLLDVAVSLARSTRLGEEGGHWMLTPAREMVLVSATQQPLGRPRLLELAAQRGLSATDCRLTGRIGVHGASTARVSLLAAWTEPVDRADAQPPQDSVPGAGTAGDVPLTSLEPSPVQLHEGGRQVGIYLPESDEIVMNADGHLRHEFHDTRHRVVTYTPRAASRFREYFPAEHGGPFTRDGEPLTVLVPSTAPPPAPQPLYAVPTFSWERQEHGLLRSSRRSGQSVRIYLSRAWHRSGEGEQLGVVLFTGALTAEQRVLFAAHVTQWGSDPARPGSPVAADLRPEHFPAASEVGSF